ncbi:MAG: pirin family protein [Mariprofundaceae bacterium]
MSILVRNTNTVPEGDGVEVKRLMPVAQLRNFDPFVLWDHFDIAGGGFPNHPHRGFEAITYMFEGGMQHSDNLGNHGTVYAGGAQRFTAGKGIVHSEMPEGRAAGIQLWINLPQSLKGIEADYQQLDSLPEQLEDGVKIRIIVGSDDAISLKSDVEYLDISMGKHSTWKKQIADGLRGFVYVVQGTLMIDSKAIAAGQAAFIEKESELELFANEDSRVMWCFGKPYGEPIDQHGPFVD